MPSSHRSSPVVEVPLPLLVLASAMGGAVALWSWQTYGKKTPDSKKNYSSGHGRKKKPNPEKNYSVGHDLVWSSISGAMNAAMMYTGDRLKLYTHLRELCRNPGSSVTAVVLAKETGYNQRWIREWLAQQAAMGVLQLLDGEGDSDEDLHYRLPAATAEVLADPDSAEYDIAMIQTVPALVNRAKTMLPEAFKTGVGRPYDEPDVAEAIDRHHAAAVREFFLPKVLPKAMNGKVLKMLETGCMVADLGCGAGILLVSLAKKFPKSTFHGFEISKVALEKASFNVASAKLKNLFLHDANEPGEQLGDRPKMFDLALIYDVLHDSTHPHDLVKQVKTCLKPHTGVFVFGDIPAAPSVRENLTTLAAPGTYYGFSACLCMSCALSTKDGAGLGTLGFSVPVAKKMLTENGFATCEVLAEDKNVRWFLAT